VVEVLLDKGVVIDAYVRVSLLGIELLTVDARVVIASVDTYLRFAEATNRLELEDDDSRGLPELLTEGTGEVVENVASKVVEKKVEPVAKPVREVVGAARSGVEKVKDVVEDVVGEDDDQDQQDQQDQQDDSDGAAAE
jgi:hypothetical protein